MAKSGARVTILDATGAVLADSLNVADASEKSANGPEVQDAWAKDAGNRWTGNGKL